MPDPDTAGNAWHTPPALYLEQRSPTHQPASRITSVYVPMDDGCRLAVDIYLPAGAQPQEAFPTIVLFTPYTRRFCTAPGSGAEVSPNTAVYRDFFVQYGYALVVVDVRGTGASFGTRDALRSPRERQDASHVADWIVQQPWSNGVIGSTGISYLAAAACFLASSGHPAVKAIAPLFGISDIYSEQLFPGGMLSRVWSTAYDRLMVALDRNNRELIKGYAYFSDPRLSGPCPVDDDLDGVQLRDAIRQHEDNFRLHDVMPELRFRGEGPDSCPELNTDVCSPFHYLKSGAREGLPVYSVSGWYDGGGYANGAISRFLTLAGPQDRLLLGPWDHGARTNISPWRNQQQPEFPILAEVLRFFDEHLLRIVTGLSEEARVHYFSIHDECWVGQDAWPTGAQERLYLSADGALASHCAREASNIEYRTRHATHTGEHTRWVRLGARSVERYYPDFAQHICSHLCFHGEVLEQPLSLAGHIVADLILTSSEADAGIFIYASELGADGTLHYMTEGMLRAMHRKTSTPPPTYQTAWPYRTYTRSDAQLLHPREAFRAEIPLLPIAWTLMKGSRLVLSIAGADEKNFPQVCPGRPPVLGVRVGTAEGSSVRLPLRSHRDGKSQRG